MERMQRESERAREGGWGFPAPELLLCPSLSSGAADGCVPGGLGQPRGLELSGKGSAAPLMEKLLPEKKAASSFGKFSSRAEGQDS